MALNATDVNGRLKYIEPTNVRQVYLGDTHTTAIIESNEMITNPLEDYCIAVDLEVTMPERKSCGLAESTGEKKVLTFSSTNGSISFMNGSSGVLTTNFTDVNPLDPSHTTNECLGIESISIAYEAWLYPEVTIRFVDVRGASVMLPEEEAYQNGKGVGSVYHALFTFPYPMFKLRVKGFYGRGATYYLCMSDTAIELDSSSGNFIITAKFTGMMYRVYSDIPMTYICVAPYLSAGQEYWNAQVAKNIFQFKNADGTTSPMITFPELRKAIADAAYSSEKQSAAGHGEMVIQDKTNRIQQLKTIIDTCPSNNPEWLEPGNGYAYRFGSQDLTKQGFAEEIDQFTTLLEKYDEAYGTAYAPRFEKISDYGKEKGKKKKYKEIKEFTYNKGSKDKDHGIDPKHATEFSAYATKEVAQKLATLEKNSWAVIKILILPSVRDGLAQVLEEMKKDIKALETEREKAKEEYKALTETLIEKALGFTPSIENIFNLAFAHMDTFMHCFNEHVAIIEKKMKNHAVDRMVEEYDCDTDLNGDEKVLPPYPAFYVYKNNGTVSGGVKTEIWPEDVGHGYALDEVNFIKDLLSASKIYAEKAEEANKYAEEARKRFEGGSGGTEFLSDAPSLSIDKMIPVTTYDFVNKDKMPNPYSHLVGSNYNTDSLEDAIFGAFALRAVYYLSTNEDGNKDAEAFGRLEAINFAKGVGEDFSSDNFWAFISRYADGHGERRDANNALKDITTEAKGDHTTFNFGTRKLFTSGKGKIKYCLAAGSENSGEGSYYPMGITNFSEIQGCVTSGTAKNNMYFVEEKESEMPKHDTFNYFDSRDYIKEIYNKVDSVLNGVSEEEDAKYQAKKASKVMKHYKDNIDDVFDKDDATFSKNVIYRILDAEEKKEEKVNGKRIYELLNGDWNDMMEEVYVKYPAIIDEDKSSCLFDSDFYKQQTTSAAKAYLFLSAMPIKPGKKSKTKNGTGYQDCGIPDNARNGVELKSVLLREGSFYWREECMANGSGDPINATGYATADPRETYMGVSRAGGFFKDLFSEDMETLRPIKSKIAKDYLRWNYPEGCTRSRKRVLIKLFLDWAKDYAAIEPLISDPKYYDDGKFKKGFRIKSMDRINNENLYKIHQFVNKTFFWVGTTLDYYAGRDKRDDKFTADTDEVKSALRGFIEGLESIFKETVRDGQEKAILDAAVKQAEDPFNNNDLRLSTYLTVKGLYDKWLSAPYKGEATWKYGDKKSDFSSFRYIDSFYRDIGTQLRVNITKVGEWVASCLPTQDSEVDEGIMRYTGKSLYEFLTETAQHTGGVLMAFPLRVGGIGYERMAEMFHPFPFNSDWNTDESSFVFIYTYKPSEHLGNTEYADDGFQLNTEQALEILGDNGYDIPAFGVSYAKQNQSYFKEIKLTTESNNMTEAAIGATLAIASKGSEGARETNLFGQDLYRVKTSYSYQCEFDMMGCVQIMPLMYFQLNNVPFWRGAYMVIKVSHDIRAGEMTTHVTGVRINRNALPMTDGAMITPRETEEGDIAQDTQNNGEDTVAGAPSGTDNNEKGSAAYDPKVMNFNKENVNDEKPVICLTPAHSPTRKSAEWHWSTMLIDDYIIPKLSQLKFRDGTSYAENIQRCNRKPGYTSAEVRKVIKTQGVGSTRVLSVVPHWNGGSGQYFAAFDGKKDKDGSNVSTRNDSQRFRAIMMEEAAKVLTRFKNGEFKKAPEGFMTTVNENFHHLSRRYEGGNDTSDWACDLNCACLLTENWFADYSSKGGEDGKTRFKGDNTKLDATKSTWGAMENGKYVLGEGWLFDEEGLNAISDMHVEAIRRYINNLQGQTSQMMGGVSNNNGNQNLLSEDIYVKCANEIGCEVEVLKAVKMVESSGKAFIADGKPPILFEGHVFWRNLSNPESHVEGNEDILYRDWTKKYYQGGLAEYKRLERAKAIDETAALKAASWGLFQILGENYRSCGCSSVQEFVRLMCESADNQLLLATKFICHSSRMKEALAQKDWATFARLYNGSGYKQNEYDVKLENAYNKIKNGQ